MIEIEFQRKKCIGCNTCVEMDPKNWKIDWMDDKSILIGSTSNNGMQTLKLEYGDFDHHKRVADNCPERIIKVIKHEIPI